MDRRSPLHAEHLALSARMTSFAGWEMPVSYPAGPIEEHRTVRSAAGLFDLSHMGEVLISGPAATDYLQRMVTSNVGRLREGRATYAPLCYADGGLVDDTFVYRVPEGYLVVVNASNRAKDVDWLRFHAAGVDVQVDDRSDDIAMLALQGPLAEAILQPLTELDLKSMARNRIRQTCMLSVPAQVARTGYTGENGFEIYVGAEDAVALWRGLLQAGEPQGLLPIGLAARDSLRFEPCFPLYGNELNATTSPLAAGLGWAVSFRKGVFIGSEALLKERLEGSARTLVGFEMTERGVPRHGLAVAVDGAPCGTVTSGLYAPTLDRFLGMAYLPAEHSATGTEIAIDVRGQWRAARVVDRPFYTPAYANTDSGG